MAELSPLVKQMLAKTKSGREAQMMSEFAERDRFYVNTRIPALNVMMSGYHNKGLPTGVTFIAGPSQSFKTVTGIHCAKQFLRQYKDGVVLFCDSEGGGDTGYWGKISDEDLNRIIRIPIKTIEDFSQQITQKLNEIGDDDKIFILLDSLGMMTSNKQMGDMLSGEDKVDMTRAKAIRAMWSVIMPLINGKNVWFVTINHTYETMELYVKQVLSGGRANEYVANQIFFMGQRQIKGDDEVHGRSSRVGSDFVFNVFKSRYVKKDTKMFLRVTFDGGIERLSGLFDYAVSMGYITQSGARVTRPNIEDDKSRFRSQVEFDAKWWKPILTETDFLEKFSEAYRLSGDVTDLLIEDDDEDYLDNL